MFTSIVVSAFLAASALALPSGQLGKRSLTITLPTNTLPVPTGTLKYVGLGIGTQNYTCATPYSSATPSAVGAVATLSDAGAFLQQNQAMIGSLAGLALNMQVWSHGNVQAPNALGLSPLGQHFFDSAGHPTFALTACASQLVAKKVANMTAPADACPGSTGEGAVPWLYLTDGGYGSTFGGVKDVYRVETAGGSAPATCVNSPASFQVPYAAEYWFYGP
jgi:Protein of unknown function (DUF3455)